MRIFKYCATLVNALHATNEIYRFETGPYYLYICCIWLINENKLVLPSLGTLS